MAKVNSTCKTCGRAAKLLAKRLGKEGYCTKHARIELAKDEKNRVPESVPELPVQ